MLLETKHPDDCYSYHPRVSKWKKKNNKPVCDGFETK